MLGDDFDVVDLELRRFDETRLDLGRDERVVAARLEVGDGSHDQLVLHGADLRCRAQHLADFGFRSLGGNLTRQQHDSVKACDVDVKITLEALVDRDRALVFDDLVIELSSRRAPIRSNRGAAGDRASHQEWYAGTL